MKRLKAKCVAGALIGSVLLLAGVGRAQAASVSADEDWLDVTAAGEELDLGDVVDEDYDVYFFVESESAASFALSGLPTGLKYDTKKKKILGTAKKEGVYYVTCSAKNKNGYQMSATCRWTVGEADDGDYDDIGIDPALLVGLEELQVGVNVESDLCVTNATSVTGLPTGLSWVAGGAEDEPGYIMGTPTKPGKFVITFAKDAARCQKTVIVMDVASTYFYAAPGADGGGTVSGSGVKRPGATVKVVAKPAKKRYFAGWYTDEDCVSPFTEGKSGDYRTATETFTYFYDNLPDGLYARFVTKAEDSTVGLDVGDGAWSVKTGDDEASEGRTETFEFAVTNSVTKPTVTAKGLPSGIALKGLCLYVSNKAKLKPGTYTVKLTAKNLSGASETKPVVVTVPNIRGTVFADLEYEDAYEYTVGQSEACRSAVTFGVDEGWSVKATGLPAGLKLTVKDGVCTLSGIATKAGTYTVTLTATKGTKKNKQTVVATFTVVVAPFPTAAVGTFGGVLSTGVPEESESDEESSEEIPYGISSVGGTFSMTVSSVGKITVKCVASGKTSSFSGYACQVEDDAIAASLTNANAEVCEMVISPACPFGGYQANGAFANAAGEEWTLLGQRNVAKTDAQMKKMVAKLKKLGKIQGVAAGGEIACSSCGLAKANMTFTVDAAGAVKASGTIEGTKVSGSVQLLALPSGEDDYLLYADFCALTKAKETLAYRAIFSWSWLTSTDTKITVKNALSGGAYCIGGEEDEEEEEGED